MERLEHGFVAFRPERRHFAHRNRLLEDDFENLVHNRRRQGRHPRIFHGPIYGRGPDAVKGEARIERMKLDKGVLSYTGGPGDVAGVYIAPHTVDHYNNYFEIDILDDGDMCQIGIGLVPNKYSLNVHPGVEDHSVGYLAENGRFYINHGRGNFDITQSGPLCTIGDRMGVGVIPMEDNVEGGRSQCKVFFTRNGQEIKNFEMLMHPSQLYPAVGMHSEGEEVLLKLKATWNPDGVTQMVVDCGEEDWCRLDDIRINGTMLEYTGKGKTIHDVGLAQAKCPLDTKNHYFEFEIVDPGKKCYLAIGLTRHNYPVRRHPGWNRGSIAYHADDGKLFHGSGVGVQFGPVCSKGDVMGCGIYFPPDYDMEAENLSDEEDGSPAEDFDNDGMNEDDLNGSDSEEDDGYKGQKKRQKGNGTEVTVFFTRNGKWIGHREVPLPKGGFFPSVGMLSCNEKVKVDLHPLTG